MSDLEKGEVLPLPSVSVPSDESSLGSTETTTTISSSLSSSLSSSSPSSHNPTTRTNRKALLTVFSAFLSLLLGFGQMNAFGTYQTWYAAHQLGHMPASTISWIGSLQLWVFFFSGCPIGRIFDKHGPTHLMIAGTLCYITSIMMTSICKVYYQYILAQGVLFGVGVGLLFYPPLASISTHFSTYRATALGVALAGSSLGGVIYPIMLTNLFQKVGFSWGVRIAGLISAVGLVVATFCVSACPIPKERENDNEGGEELKVKEEGDEKGNEGEGVEGNGGAKKRRGVKSLIDTRFLLLAGGSSIAALGLFIPFFYIVDHARHLSPSPPTNPSTSFYVLAVLNAGGVLGRIAPAYYADSLGRFNLLFPSSLFCALSCLTIWLNAHNFGVLMAFAAVYGFFSGAFISLVNPCVAQISEIREIGRRMGLLYTIISFPALVGGPAAGALLSKSHGSFTGMIIFSGCTLLLGSLFILLAKLAVDSRVLARV